MDLVRVAAASLNLTPLAFAENEEKIIQMIRQAKADQVEVLCFPELCITGYGCEDMFFSLYTARNAQMSLERILGETTGIFVVLGLPVYWQGNMYNCAAMCQDGKLLGLNPKKYLPREGVHYEPRWFHPWSFNRVEEISLAGEKVPFGDFRYQLGSLGIAVEICEDAWGPKVGAMEHAGSGVELVLNPSASHFALGKHRVRETIVKNSSRAMQVYYVYANLSGLEAGRMIYDGGCLIAGCGTLLGRSKRFGFRDGYLLSQTIDLDLARTGKIKNRSIANKEETSSSTTAVIHANPPRGAAHQQPQEPVSQVMSENEEFLCAEMMGLYDYMRKAGAKGYVVSLSGGCDSAVCAVLIAHMVVEALGELGPELLADRWGLSDADTTASVEAWIARVLTTVYQQTANSSAATKKAARDLAAALGATHYEVDVSGIVSQYEDLARTCLGRGLSWQTDDLSLQNIQARARAPLAWFLANLNGQILITTSNRSEASVGYVTMDGDSAGGLAPLAGIDKSFLRRWLLWAQGQKARGLGPVSALEAVGALAPSAELRPQGMGQADETDLMPYDILGRIERLFVRDRMGPDDIVSLIEAEFSLEAKIARQYVTKFFRLWTANQWKRERLAPGFHLDDESIDPKTWCRYPIFSKLL